MNETKEKNYYFFLSLGPLLFFSIFLLR